MATATEPLMLTGNSLLSYVNDNQERINRGELTRTELIKDAGYVYNNGKAMYVDFYTELLRAKGVTPVTDTDVEGTLYEDMSSDQQELYDFLEEQSFTEKWDHEQFIEFMSELADISIETRNEFEESFVDYGYTHKEFAEYWYIDVCGGEVPESLRYFIDWDNVWDQDLRYEFSTIDFDYDTFYFHNK